jgi:hypothetical protein
MTSDEGRKPEGAFERSAKAGVGAPSGVDGNGPKALFVQRKIAIVARLFRASRWTWWPGKRMSPSPEWRDRAWQARLRP